MSSVLFNIPFVCPESADNVKYLTEHPAAVNQCYFVQECAKWFEVNFPGYTAFMTTSCTRAMEMIALALGLERGDEIILSPFTYVGVGNAFANYGAKLVFTDVRPETMNIDADRIEAGITGRTKAVIAMHYAGIPCEMEKIRDICLKHNLILIEDNAQGIQATYKQQKLGSFGDFSCMSFDMQKNISCNEGGVLLCKNVWTDRVDVVYNNGTNKTAFSRGEVKKYEWVGKGSKFAMSEYTAAVLYPLLKESATITANRKKIWHSLYAKLKNEETLRKYIPNVMLETDHNAHIAYLIFESPEQRNGILQFMNSKGIPCLFHYIPLDDSIQGGRVTDKQEVCQVSYRQSNCLLRLPMHNYLSEQNLWDIVNALKSYFSAAR